MGLRDLLRRLNLTVFGWVKDRFPTAPYADLTRKVGETIQRQVPRSHSEKYELKTIWYWYPLYCLGGISFIAFIILTITGIVLGFYYVPDGTVTFTSELEPTNPAYESMVKIMNEVPLGFIMRGVHHWGAHVMIAAVFLHMCRVYFTGAYKKPRELNWIIGVILLFLTLGFGYTGYLLPANDLSQAAATIGLNMARSLPYIGDLQALVVFGGTDIAVANYVLRMYWYHVFILPFTVIGLMLFHMALVWIQGVAEPH
ncbi:MAG TPA: cytochrome b N-terminal domain-containing protein [Thermoplasmata archaeon]|nr:cytochrome b N-terminal domain-containing protein [Thermoplasmata archaeon]HLA47110.1 cytochrome b N-terminal domain-containing protein [Thermoplasmata archaeon]